VRGFTNIKSVPRQIVIREIPRKRAVSEDTLPEGRGRSFVLSMSESISFSIKQLMTQAPPTSPDVARIEINPLRMEISPGARNIPRALVKITREESLGFVNENKSER
jgi:hypothetical protein